MKRKSNVRRYAANLQAEKVWTDFGLTDPKQFALEDLAMAMGILVVDAPLEAAAARLVRKGDRGLIRVSDAIQHDGQRRFAIAHEIGHFVMHGSVSQLLACTDADIQASYQSGDYEIEASVFAGGLLMPTASFRSHVSARVPTRSLIAELAETFATSITATALRYVETSKDYCVFVVSEGGHVRWWRPSAAFDRCGLWFVPQMSLPSRSPAAAYFRNGRCDEGPVELDWEDWFDDTLGLDAEYIVEQAIPMPRYGQVISLLWLE